MKNKGFTLIELLVVIAIIGLLASVILVNTGGIRGKAKVAKALEFSQSVQTTLGSEAVGIWSFDEGQEGAPLVSAKDASGYNNNGTCSGASCPTYTSDTPQKVVGSSPGKYALSFNGSTNYVSVPNADSINFDRTQPFTISMWLKANSIPASGSNIITKIVEALGAKGYRLMFMPQQTLYFLFTDNHTVTDITLTTPSTLTPGNWYYFVATYNGNGNTNGMALYLNGQLDISGGGGNLTATTKNTVPLIMGTNNEIFRFFNGLIDEVRIYAQALTLSEIQKHYAEGLTSHPNFATK